MHATLRRYEETPSQADTLTDAVRRLASPFSQITSFVCYVVIEETPGALTTIGVFEDRAGSEEADRLVRGLADEQSARLPEPVLVTTGEIIFQRGM